MSKHPTKQPSNSNRRSFLKAGGIMGAAVLGSAALPDVVRGQSNPPTHTASSDSMPTRNLGKTGYKVGIFSLGGQASLEKPNNEAVAVPIIERALDLGVNYRHVFDLWWPRSLERAIHRQGHEKSPQRRVSGDENQGADARWFHAHDRNFAQAVADWSRRLMAAPRYRNHDGYQ